MKRVVFLLNEKDSQIPGDYSASITWWYGILENFGYDVMYYDYKNFNFDNFYTEIKEFKPDFIIHACYDKLHTEFVKLREVSKVFVMQSDDDYRFHNYGRFWIPFVDGIISFCGERQTMRDLYFSHGATEDTFLHGYWCFNPNTMMLNEPYPSRNIMMTHMGSIYGNRPMLINSFINRGINVQIHKLIPYEQFKKTTAQSKFTLCLTMDATQQIRQLKGRLFELPNLSVLVAEPFPNMDDYYDLDKEIIVFTDIQDAVERMKGLTTNEKSYLAMFEAGRKRVLSCHTCYHVWDKYILPKMDLDYKKTDIKNILKEKHGIEI